MTTKTLAVDDINANGKIDNITPFAGILMRTDGILALISDIDTNLIARRAAFLFIAAPQHHQEILIEAFDLTGNPKKDKYSTAVTGNFTLKIDSQERHQITVNTSPPVPNPPDRGSRLFSLFGYTPDLEASWAYDKTLEKNFSKAIGAFYFSQGELSTYEVFNEEAIFNGRSGTRVISQTFNPASASIGVKIDYTKDITAASLVDAKGNVVYTFDDLEETFFRITLTNQCEQCPSTEGTDFTYFYEVAQVPEDDTKILPTVISSVESGTGFCAPTVFGKSTTF